MIITSRNNPTIKQIRALQRRREREERGLCFVEGLRIVAEAVQLDAPIEELVVAPELLISPFGRELVERARGRGIPSLEVSGDVFRSLSLKEGPQGLGAVVRQRWDPLSEVSLDAGLCWVALEAASDPGNLGTIVRTGDAVGAAGIILLGHSTDPYDPAALRASMGALFAQRLVRATVEEFAEWKRSRGCTIVGASGAAPVDYQATRYPRPLILLMGSERHGLSSELQALCDLMVSIPMVGRSDSLNLAVSTAVVLYEIFNQQRRIVVDQQGRQQ